MTLQDIYDQLAYGELRQWFMGGSDINTGNVGIQPNFYAQYIPFIKSGLTDLHTRFLLREASFLVEIQPNKSTYVLTSQFAQSNTRSQEPVKYIDDSAEKFTDNLLKIHRVYGVLNNEEYEIPFNDQDDSESIWTTQFNILAIPDTSSWLVETVYLDVDYQADHPTINIPRANASPISTPIYLPPQYLEALVFYIASRKLNTMGHTPGAMHEGNNYFQRYEAACAILEDRGHNIRRTSYNDRATNKGWI